MTYGKGRTYKKLELIGISKDNLEGAIQAAVERAHETMGGLSWFEVQEIHGHVGKDGKVSEYQVVLKLAFELK